MKFLCFILAFAMLIAMNETAVSSQNAEETAHIQSQGHHIFAFFEIGSMDTDPERSISNDDFKQILHEIIRGHYSIVSLDNLTIPTQTTYPKVSLTFDGGYRSFADNALPLLKERKIPFTLFITPEQINRNSPTFMTWEEIKDISDLSFATVALQADYYVPLPVREDEDIRTGLNKAISLFEQHMGFKPEYIAYPFGMYDEKTLDIVSEYSFIKAGFGLNSSVISDETPRLTLPRFALTGDYADINRFKMVANALPMPIYDTTPSRSTIVDKNAPSMGFSIRDSINNLDKLSCFGTGYGAIKTELLGNRVELRFDTPLKQGKRLRINCTLPLAKDTNTTDPDNSETAENWYWYGMLIQPR